MATVSAWPCGSSKPETSVLNFEPGRAVPNMVALEYTDEYVWIYTQNVSLWERPEHWPLLPDEYRDAMLAAHDPALALPTAVEDEPAPTLPRQNSLWQNYPNPFNSSTVIRFALHALENVELSVHNLMGQQVITLVDGPRPAGSHTVYWDGLDDNEQLATAPPGWFLIPGAWAYTLPDNALFMTGGRPEISNISEEKN